MKKLVFIVMIAFCSIPTLESSFWSKISQSITSNYHTHYHKINACSIGSGVVGTGYLITKENLNDASIKKLAQELKITQDILAQVENNSVSNKTFWAVSAILGFSCYVAIRIAYHNNKLLNHPTIDAIIESEQTTNDADIKTIEAALS